MVADGLKPGEQVIVTGQLRVAPNAKVIGASAACPQLRRKRPRRIRPVADCEYLRTFHQAAHHDHAGHGCDFDFWCFAYRLLPVSDLPNVDFPPF